MRALTLVTLAALALVACSSDTSSNTEQSNAGASGEGGSAGDGGSGGDGGTSAGSGDAGNGGTAGDGGNAGEAGEGGTSGEGGSSGSAPQVCAPGQQISCACPGSTVKGAQSCKDDGSGYLPCEGCPSGEGGSGGASGSGGSAGDAGSSGTSGSGGDAGSGACVPVEPLPKQCGGCEDTCGNEIACPNCILPEFCIDGFCHQSCTCTRSEDSDYLCQQMFDIDTGYDCGGCTAWDAPSGCKANPMTPGHYCCPM